MQTDSQYVIDIRDGLNTTIRGILSVLHNELPSSGPFRRSSRVVQQINELYNIDPEVCYDIIVDLALLDWPLRLVDGHGKFDFFPAPPDFSECRSSFLFDEYIAGKNRLEDISVPFRMTFPILLFRGTPGFCHSSTKIPQHRFSSVMKAVLYLLKYPCASVRDLLQIMKGPHLYYGGTIINTEELADIYERGFGEIRFAFSREALSSDEWDGLKGICADLCNWYGHKLTKHRGLKAGHFEITVKYNALFTNGSETRYYSIKEILQSFIDNYRIMLSEQSAADADNDALSKSLLGEIRRLSGSRSADVYDDIAHFYEEL